MRGIGNLREAGSGLWFVLLNYGLLPLPVVKAALAELLDFLHQPRESVVQLFEYQVGCRILRTINIHGLSFQLLTHLFELDGLEHLGILIFGGLHPPLLVFHLLSEISYHVCYTAIIHAALEVTPDPIPQLIKHRCHLCIKVLSHFLVHLGQAFLMIIYPLFYVNHHHADIVVASLCQDLRRC